MATLTITGTVVHQNGNPIADILVVVSERQLRTKKTLADKKTARKGIFSIPLMDVSDKTDYFVEVQDGTGKTLTSQGPFSAKAGDRNLKLVLEDGSFKGEVIFKTREPELAAFVEEWRQGGTNKAVTADDARFVAAQTDLPPAEVWRWMKAHQLEEETKKGSATMPAEALYGLLKQGLPGNLAALSALPSREIEVALERALDANQISGTPQVSDLMKQWNEALIGKSLDEKPEGLDASLGEILDLAGISASQQKKMLELFSQHEGTDEQFWEQIGTVINSPNKAAKTRKALQLTAFTGFQPLMVKALLAENLPGDLHAVAALAGKDAQDWEAFIQAASAQNAAVPAFIKGGSEAERRQRYAAQLAKTTEAAFPTHAFFGRLSKLENASGGFGNTKTDLQAFFAKNPGFDFKTASVAALAEGSGLDLSGIADPQNLLKELRSVRRMKGFVQNFEALQSLRKAGLDSAVAVANMPRNRFVEQHAAAFGSPAEARQAHGLAEKKSSQLSALWAAGHPNLNLETAATNGISTEVTRARGAGDSPNLRSLFGSLEACDCEHCLSVFSPAAYLTDLLHFLESRSLPAYEELVRRRPDLPLLLLNCENTNTPMPYVDLAIELLENFVAKPQTPSEYQTTLTATELAANPEHGNPDAYEKLKNAVYPASLPFHFPLEESRVYLSHLKLPRHKLMSCFFPGKEIAAFDNGNVAMEYLGISVRERDIITAQITGDGSADNGTWNFFGFDKATGFKAITDPAGSGNLDATGTWLEVLSERVDVFLQQTGLRYVELLTLLSCDFINPENAKITIVAAPGAEKETCQLDKLQLNGLDENHLVRMHRFLRLSRCLKWGFYDLDKALKSMSVSGFLPDGTPAAITAYLTSGYLRRFSQIEQLRRRFDCTVDEIMAIWLNLRAEQYTDFEQDKPTQIPSLYEQLFRNKAVLNPLNDALKADPAALSGSMDSHAASIQAALQIGDADYRLLRSTGTVAANGNLSLRNLSAFYRHVALARWMGLSIPDLLTVIALSGDSFFESPPDTYALLWKADFIQASGFSLAELDYLLRDRFTEASGLAPSKEAIKVFLEEVKALVESTETNEIPEQVEILKKNVTRKFAEAFGLTPKATDLLLNEHLKSTNDPTKTMVQDFLLPGATEAVKAIQASDYRKFGKAAFWVKKFKISDAELEQILENQAKIGCLDFNALPVAPQASANWAGFEALVNLIRARDLFSFGTTGLFEVLGNAIEANTDKKKWVENLVRLSNWDASTLETLFGKDTDLTNGGILKTKFPDDFTNGNLILRLKKSLDALRTVGLNAGKIAGIVLSEPTELTVQAIKQAVKAKYGEAQWLKIAKPLRDVLRERQRAALVDFAISRSGNWNSVEELYEYLLIDVEMKPVSMTSRLKQATCSVQLFIDRVLMNLESDTSESDTPGVRILLEPEQAEEWKTWRKIYRVWEANRKIFLYPENWIEPELRDDQTPFFKEAASQLLQNELTPETVEDAFRGYLKKLDEVARLEIVGIVRQKEDATDDIPAVDILHVFGRTYTQPHKYFHRTYEKGEWSPWLKIETDIDSDHLVPVIFNRRLCLFWLFFMQEAVEPKPINPSSKEDLPTTKLYWKIQAAWSEFRSGAWTGKKLSKSYVKTEDTDIKGRLERLRKGLFVRTYLAGDRLLVNLTPASVSKNEPHFYLNGKAHCHVSFLFENTASEPSVIFDLLPTSFSLPLPSNAEYENEQIKGVSPSLILQYETVNSFGDITSGNSEPVLAGVVNIPFRLSVEAGAAQPFEGPFVFQDGKNTFFVEPSSYRRLHSESLSDLPDMFVMERSAEQIWGKSLQPGLGSLNRMKQNDTDPPTPRPPHDEDEDENSDDNSSGSSGVVPVNCPKNEFQVDMPNGMAVLLAKSYAPTLNPSGRIRHRYQFSTFFHPQVKNFIRNLNKSGVPGVLRRSVQKSDDLISFPQYQPTLAVIGDPPQGIVDFAYGSPYSQYNWELFFHLPIQIACRLSADQRFEEARKWFHFVFDPTSGEDGGKERFWHFLPFHEEAKTPLVTLENLLNSQAELQDQLEKWAANPFQPHVIARMRITAYMKFTVMKYVDNLLAWGDQLFRRDTIESTNEATNLYVLAAKILGTPPQKIPALKQRDDQDFETLKPHLDAFSNVNLEDLIPHSETGDEATGTGTASALGSMFYFGVPRNEYLLKYWKTVADRLFKIRHSLNIEGVARSLPLFEPPIDPALLVRAAAAGLDLNSLLNEVNPGVSLYRFAFMLQKANELVNEVKGLGASLLSALEKRDAEALSLLRSGHEQHLLSAVLMIREKQVEEAKEQIKSLEKSKESAVLRKNFYSTKWAVNALEIAHLALATKAMLVRGTSAGMHGISAVLKALGTFKFGSPATVGVQTGPKELGESSESNAISSEVAATLLDSIGSMVLTTNSYLRRKEEWTLQADVAEKEIQQLEKQILASEIRLAIAEREKSNHHLQMEQSAEADEFMRSKFTNRQLFDWMSGQLSALYFQTYQMAYDLAKKAEQCFQFELSPATIPATEYVKFGYWDNLKKGLLAGEKLQFDLRRLENAHLEQNKREFEITKHISLRQINPMAVLTLRDSGKCGFTLPEVLFDMDFPGHYRRRIKSVSISLPCISGPYTGLNATLRLMKNEYRRKANLIDGLISNNVPFTAIAVSTGQNDSGLFELNFRDERYLPFEGAGVISTWELDLPEFRQFDYDTISDVVLHIRYTALEALDQGEQFKTDVSTGVANFIGDAAATDGLFAIIDLQHDLPTEWHKALQHKNTAGEHFLTIPDLEKFLPFYAMTYVRNEKFEIADTQFFHSSEVTEISLTETISLKNKEVKFKSTDLPDKPIQKAFLVIRFTVA